MFESIFKQTCHVIYLFIESIHLRLSSQFWANISLIIIILFEISFKTVFFLRKIIESVVISVSALKTEVCIEAFQRP